MKAKHAVPPIVSFLPGWEMAECLEHRGDLEGTLDRVHAYFFQELHALSGDHKPPLTPKLKKEIAHFRR